MLRGNGVMNNAVGGFMKRLGCLLSILLLTAVITFAGELIQQMTFSPSDLAITQEKGYTRLNYGLYPNYDDVVGNPALPELPLYVVIPPSAVVTSFEVLSADVHTLQGDYLVIPAQNTRPFSVMEEPPFVEPNKEVYNSKAVWPENIVQYHSTGNKGGFQIGAFRVYPVRYIPAERKLLFCTNLKVKITYQEGVVEPLRRTERQIEVHSAGLTGLVANPQDIKRFSPPLRTGLISSPFLPAGNYEHIILTPTAYKDTFKVFADWRTKNGIPSRVFCIESTATYPGADVAEKMRNFLRDADTTWGLIFAFIARTDAHLTSGTNRQYRNCWAYYSGSYQDTLPCDMYFSDLWRGTNRVTYTWDGNRNGRYGEANDTIDYYSDIYVGMVTLDDMGQARNWMRKVLRHEGPTTDSTYFAKVLLMNGVTFSDSFLNRIAEATPANWIDCKMYLSGAGGITPTTQRVIDSINAGYGYFCIIAHGTVTSFYVNNTEQYTVANVSQQNNLNKLNTVIAVSCHPGAFDQGDECLAETMAVYPGGGYINIMMNSRYGWVAVAELYNTYFMHNILPKGSHPDTVRYPCFGDKYVGQSLARVKDRLVYKYPRPGIGTDSSRWRWESYEKNLFGDPAGFCHTTRPIRSMRVTHPATIRTGSQVVRVSVDVSAFAPVDSVLITLWKGTEVYARGYTNTSGYVDLTVNPTTAGQMSVTANKRNYRTYEGTIQVTTGVAEEDNPVLPTHFALGQSKPNPFGKITSINYQTPHTVKTRLTIYDASGRTVRTLIDRKDNPGWYTVNWDGRDDRGLECSAGIYFYRLEAGNYTATRSLVIVR